MPDHRSVLRVLHLAGSPTSDFYAEVSRVYAVGALEALRAAAELADVEHVPAWVDPGGGWRFPTSFAADDVEAAVALDLPAALAHVAGLGVDVMLPQLFCLAGMTHYRALFDVLGVPYPGNPPAVMALGADKALARAVVAAGGVAVPEGVVVRVGEPVDLPGVSGPLVVKPVDADNSLGLSLVRDPAELPAAVEAACVEAESGRAIVERFVPLGREVRCGVVDLSGLGDGRGLTPLPLEEYAVDAATKPIRDRADKLAPSTDRDGAGLSLVAKDADHAWIVADDDPCVPAVHEAALAAYAALGCRDYGLFDFRIDPEGRPWFLEASLYCSYAPSSVLAVMARAAGLDLPTLFRAATSQL